MLRMAMVFHLFIGSTLAGVGVIVALTTGYDTLKPILGAAALGFLLSFPVTYLIAKMVYENR